MYIDRYYKIILNQFRNYEEILHGKNKCRKNLNGYKKNIMTIMFIEKINNDHFVKSLRIKKLCLELKITLGVVIIKLLAPSLRYQNLKCRIPDNRRKKTRRFKLFYSR